MNYRIAYISILLLLGCSSIPEQKSDAVGSWYRCLPDGEYQEHKIEENKITFMSSELPDIISLMSNQIIGDTLIITGISFDLIRGTDTLIVVSRTDTSITIKNRFEDFSFKRMNVEIPAIDSSNLEASVNKFLNGFQERTQAANCPIMEEKEPLELGEVEDDFEDIIDIGDCVFNDDIKGQSVEALLEYDSNLDYEWNEGAKEVTAVIDKDTVYVSMGGCYHYGFTAGLRTSNQNFDDTAFWFSKAKWIANSFLWKSIGEDYTRVIDNGQLIKRSNNTLNEVHYNFPPDTSITNIYIEGVTISRSPKGTTVEVGGYMN